LPKGTELELDDKVNIDLLFCA